MILLILSVILISNISFSGFAVNIGGPISIEPVEISQTGCGTLNSSIVLTRDIVSQGTCFTIAANNIIIDCQGHSITGTHIAVQPSCTGSTFCSQWNRNSKNCTKSPYCNWNNPSDPNLLTSYGIYSDGYNNVEIRNCKITNFTSGIYIKNTQNTRITDNTLQYNTDQGIKLTNPRQSLISRNTASHNGFRFFFDWDNLHFPLPVDFDGIYINYRLEPIKNIASTEVNNPQDSMTGKAAQQPTTILPVSCTDSDGGWNLQVKGTCSDSNSTFNDSCFMQGSTTFLREYYCMSGICQSTPYNCAALGSHCIDGACQGNKTNEEITQANLFIGNNIISNNNLTENSLSGIVIDKGVNNNVIEHNNAYMNGENRNSGIVVYSDYNEIRNNNATFNEIAGIAAYTSSHNKIHDNVAYHNNYFGILIEDSSHYNEIYNNRIEYNACVGVYINRRTMGGEDTASTYNRIYDNQILNNTMGNPGVGGACDEHYGILIDISPYTYVYNNYIKDNGVGISPDISHHQYYYNNTFVNDGGIQSQLTLPVSNNTIFISSNILFNSNIIFFERSGNLIISSNVLFNSIIDANCHNCNLSIKNNYIINNNDGTAISAFIAQYPLNNRIFLLLENNTIVTSYPKQAGLFITYDSQYANSYLFYVLKDNVITTKDNETFPVHIMWVGWIKNNTSLHLTNMTYNKNMIEFYFPQECDSSSIIREWYLKVFVRDRTGRPIDNAIIQLRSSTGVIYNSRTDANGTTLLLTLPEYQRELNWTEDCQNYNVITNWFSPYTLTVSKQGYKTKTMQLDLDRSKDIIIILEK